MQRRTTVSKGMATLAGLLAAGVLAAPAAAVPKPPPAPPAAAVRPAHGPVPAGDELVSARADTSGYHLFAAGAADAWAWHPLATLQPAGYSGEAWTGSHCLTGDGKWIVAVVAPWHANNSMAGFDQGGFAYAVDAHSGAVKPLASQVSLAYFNPGCGAGSQVALTRFAGSDQSATRIVVADASTGGSHLAATAQGEVTSAVPALSGVVAARGSRLVELSGGVETQLASLPGPTFGIHPASGGGVDLLSQVDREHVRAYTYRPGTLTAVASGGIQRMHLYLGRSGHNLVTGADTVSAASGLTRVDDGGNAPEAVSLAGSAILTPSAALPARTSARVLGQDTLPSAAGPVTRALPRPAAVLSQANVQASTPDPWQDPPAKYQSPRCAIPRNDLGYQVIQPGTDQIFWAADRAVTGGLTGARSGTPNHLASYVPNNDFPKPVLAGSSGVNIPVNIVWAILAQESNWDQASWHVPRGSAGNPLTADYYGVASDPAGTVNYDLADCGYGLGQITSLMQLAQPGAAPSLQQKAIAVDYQENIAAAVSILGAKWNDLYGKGITLNDGNATYIENWYFAIWAYNSGLQPSGAKYGNATGCDPGPNCTDSADGNNPGGNWGLGFGNNPANPGYDPQRKPFLRATYDDARTPGKWPYQEKVFGWMETPLRLGHNVYYPALPQYLNIPTFGTFCSPSVNHCTYDASTKQGTCAYTDLHCWWHQNVGYVSCPSSAVCRVGSDPTQGSVEPNYPTNPAPGICDLNANIYLPGDMQDFPTADTTIVDDESIGGNTALTSYGCGASGRNWRLGGTFTPNFATDPNTGGATGQVDWHQLSGGFGGHMFFTHTVALGTNSDAATWDPQLAQAGFYEVRAYVPAIGAVTKQAHYQISNVKSLDGGVSIVDRYVDESTLGDEWADLGFYHLNPGATVTLTTQTADGNGTEDIAFDALAFIHITPGSYVALGDSYSAGEGMGIPAFENSSDIPSLGNESANGDGCHRNLNAYPRQYALQTTAFANRPVVHLACSGADIDDVLGTNANNSPGNNPDLAGNAFYNEPYQLDQIPPDAKLVTLTVGGNDAGFIDVITQCVTLDTLGQGVLRCKPAYTDSQGNDILAQKIAALAPRLNQVYTAVKAAAPNAHIVVLTYPQVFNYDPTAPDTSVDCSGIGNADRGWLSGITNQLDNEIAQQATSVGLDVLDERNAFAGHRMCDPSPDVFTINIFWLNGSYHPTPAGYTQEAADLKTHLAALNY